LTEKLGLGRKMALQGRKRDKLVDKLIEARELVDAGDLVAAEELYVEVGEQPKHEDIAASAINSLAYSILIPSERFEEARLWLQDAINLDAGYESWNARSNMGACEFFSGNIEASSRYFQQVIDAGIGPIDEAEEFLGRIEANEIPTPPKNLELHYSSEWQDIDVSDEADTNASQRDLYLRLIRFMFENNVDVDLDLFNQAPGACATGFANGVLQDLSSEIEISRDAAAKAYFDFVRYQYFGIDENYDPFVFGERLISEENDDDGLKHLRIAAGLGNSKAMLRIGEILTELDFEDDALPWLRLAKANGEDAADRLIEANEDSRWLDDDDDDDEDDSFRIV
jgi:hypothetical protein